jgi:phage shock protein A
MAGLMSRFTTLFKVKANTMLDKAEDPARPSTTATSSSSRCSRR